MNRTSAIFLSLTLLALAGCGATQKETLPRSTWMQNPLFADRYGSELSDRMVSMQINEKTALAKDKKLAALVQKTNQQGLDIAKDAHAKIKAGLFGTFVPVKEEFDGSVLVRSEAIYLGTDFLAYAGPNLRIYLSTIVDPRDGTFPDKTAIDAGELQSPYGAQVYPIELKQDLKTYKTVILYDSDLKRIYGFAQVSPQE